MDNSDYNLNNLIKINVRNQNLQMYVQPRFVNYYVDKSYESFSVTLLVNNIKNNGVFIDIGAHYGYYSMTASIHKKNCEIISFEPVPENYYVFKKNIYLNKLKNIRIHQKAVSNVKGNFEFRLSEASDSSGFHGHPQTPTIKRINIKTIKIDDLDLKNVDVVKIDTEGHEINVLEGMKKTIKKSKDIKLFIEFNPKCLIHAGNKPEDLLIKLKELGFNCYAIDDDEYNIKEINQFNWFKLVEKDKYVNIMCLRDKPAMRVLFFNHTAGLGGSERSLLELIDELQDLGVICKVIVPYYGDLCRELEKRAVEYQIIEYHWWCSLDKKPKELQVSDMNSSIANLMTQKSSLDAWGPDVIFTNTLTIPWGGVYSQLANKPHMTFIREFGDIDFNFDFFYGFKGSLDFINEYSDYIFTNSKATLNHFRNYIDRTKSDYAYAYINIDKKLINSKTKSLFKKKKSLKLAIMGAIIPSKGQEETVRAAVSLIRKGLDIELAIIGSKHDQSFIDKLNSIIKSGSSMTRIKFYDFVVNPYNLMRQCDAIIVASSNEAYGRVAIEAMSMGKPVIGTNSGATKEIVINDEAGLLYTPGNHQELAEKIEFLYNNRNKAKELGKKAQRRYKKIFNKSIYGMKVFNKLKKINNNWTEKGAMAKLMNDFSSSLYDQLQKKDLEIEGLKKFQAQIIKERDDYNMKLGAIYSSKTWKVLYFYKKIINSIRVFQVKFKK